MIEKLKIIEFDTIYDLMEMSFPSDEYRTYDEQKALLNNPAYSIYVLHNESQDVKAFISVWEFNKFVFIDFAVNPDHRNGGIGAYILNEVINLFGKTVCLEVEPPETEMASRRIVPLFIMTSGNKVKEDIFTQIKHTLYTKVYKCI